jgi:LuxR family maltose regulon positive regulatory protein
MNETAPTAAGSPASAHVPRRALCERALAAASVRLIVVRAPAGFGKTTAMAQMRERFDAAGAATAWLTLDRADNDVSRFVGVLQRAVARIAQDQSLGGAPDALLRRLAGHAGPFVLFLDDFERIQDAAVLGLVREIVGHLPNGGRVVIGARSQPDLRLARLRAHGQLLEIDQEDLRFTQADTGAFFALRPELRLEPDAVEKLHCKTEGWVAALALAAMALQRHHPAGKEVIEGFGGSNRAVARYLMDAVLARQNEATRQFLLRTSILRRLESGLCVALAGSEGARILEQLESEALFITPAPLPPQESEHPAWRYNNLFADFLRAELVRTQPSMVMRLHLAASGWYEDNGRPVPAIDHAIEGGDFPHAAELLVRHAESFVEQGRLRLLARWLGSLPVELVERQPILQVTAVWADCFTRGPAEALARLERSGFEHSRDAAVRAHAAALKPLLLAFLDRYEDAMAAGQDGMAALPTCRPFADIVLSNAMARVMSVLGEPAQSHRLLEIARRLSQGDPNMRRYTESTEGILDLLEGRLRQASARFRMAAGTTPGKGYNHVHGNAWAGVLYAATVYESGDLDHAQHLLNVYQPLVRDVALPDHMIIHYTLCARIAFVRGDVDASLLALSDMEYEGHHRRLPRVIAAAQLERARLLLQQGHALAARESLDRADAPGLWERVRGQRLPSHDMDDLVAGRLRWEIAFGDAAATLPRLDEEIAAARTSSRLRRALKLRMLRALAAFRCADIAGALQTLEPALREACRDGFLRLVLDEGPAMAPLLQRLHATLQERMVSDPIFGDYLQRLMAAVGPAAPEPAPSVGDAQLQGALTRQEVKVLQLLADGYSNGAMAEKLAVSDSTVRTHLRSINVKLNAHSRTQAVAVARRLAVIA